MAINLETLQIQFEVRDNTGSKLKKLQSQLDRMESPEIGADTQQAQKKIQDLKQATEEMEVEMEVGADTDDAEKKLKKVSQSAKTIGGVNVEIGGDRSGFDAVANTVKGAAENIDAGDADIGGDRSRFDTVTGAITGAADDIDAGDAEIGGDKTQFDRAVGDVKDSVGTLPDGNVTIYGNPDDAKKDIEEVDNLIDELPEKPQITPEVDTREAEGGIKKIWNMMKAVGIVAAGKKVFEFGMSAANEAYAAQAVKNQIENLGGTKAQDRIDAFTKEMYDAYGLNEAGLAAMAKNFSAVFKGTGMELDDALDKGIEFTRMTIDYASALDKTPGEAADYFMSILRGNTEVADSIGIYGFTADVLSSMVDDMNGLTDLENELAAIEKKRATAEESLAKANPGSAQADKEKQRLKEYDEQEKALKAQIEQQKKLNADTLARDKAMAVFNVAKNNADIMGFTGDWERTYGEYGNQTTLLGENWKTLKEDIGNFLLPAATDATNALNSLMQSVSGWLETMGESTFSKQLSDYFGTAEMTEAQKQQIIDGIVGPVEEINSRVTTAMNGLNTTLDGYKTANANLMKLLGIFYGTGEVDEAQVDNAYNELLEAARETLTTGEDTLIEMFLAYTGTSEQWAEAEQAGVAGINAYYDGLTKAVEEKHAAFKAMLDEAMADGTFTREEMTTIKQAAMETARTTLEGSQISYGAATQQYLDDMAKKGEFSAESIHSLYTGAFEAAADERAKMEEDYNALRQKMYEVAEANRREYEKDPAAYIEKYGAAPATAQEMLAGAQAEYDLALVEMEANLTDQISRFMMQGYLNGLEQIFTKFKTGEYDGVEAASEIGKLFGNLKPLGDKLIAHEAFLGESGKTMLNIYRFLEAFTVPEPVSGRNWESTVYSEGVDLPTFELIDFVNQKFMELFPSSYESLTNFDLFPNVPSTETIYSGMTAAANDIRSAGESLGDFASSLPDRIVVEAHLNVGGYEFGVAAAESERMLVRSIGGYASPSYQSVR